MARRARGAKRSRSGRGGKSGKPRKRGGRTARGGRLSLLFERFKTLATSLVLLAAGALIGSFWLQWRKAQLPESGSASGAPGLERRLKIEVLNGSGEPGAARVVGDLLLGYGYDVVSVDNADGFDYEVTHVIDRAGIGASIEELAARVGCDSIFVDLEPDLLLDATVILGGDWRERLPGH